MGQTEVIEAISGEEWKDRKAIAEITGYGVATINATINRIRKDKNIPLECRKTKGRYGPPKTEYRVIEHAQNGS